jgi:hypothetical protein
MTKAARSVLAFGYYLVLTGVVLYTVPNTLLTLLHLPPTSEPWIRVVGIPVGAMGAMHVAAAHSNLIAFFRISIWTRTIAVLAFALLVLLRLAPPILIAFGLIDGATALWTRAALREPAA